MEANELLKGEIKKEAELIEQCKVGTVFVCMVC